MRARNSLLEESSFRFRLAVMSSSVLLAERLQGRMEQTDPDVRHHSPGRSGRFEDSAGQPRWVLEVAPSHKAGSTPA